MTLQTALKIDASNLYCKITLVWLDSSLSVPLSTLQQKTTISKDCVEQYCFVITTNALNKYYII